MQFTLFSRSNCPLCEQMEKELSEFIDNYQIVVERQYIDNVPDLQSLYGEMVPVLTLRDEVICYFFLDADVLRNTITAEKNKLSSPFVKKASIENNC